MAVRPECACRPERRSTERRMHGHAESWMLCGQKHAVWTDASNQPASVSPLLAPRHTPRAEGELARGLHRQDRTLSYILYILYNVDIAGNKRFWVPITNVLSVDLYALLSKIPMCLCGLCCFLTFM